MRAMELLGIESRTRPTYEWEKGEFLVVHTARREERPEICGMTCEKWSE